MKGNKTTEYIIYTHLYLSTLRPGSRVCSTWEGSHQPLQCVSILIIKSTAIGTEAQHPRGHKHTYICSLISVGHNIEVPRMEGTEG